MNNKMMDASKHIEIMDFLEDLVTQHNGDITYIAVKVFIHITYLVFLQTRCPTLHMQMATHSVM